MKSPTFGMRFFEYSLDKSDPRLGELQRLHQATGGWCRRNDKLNGGRGEKEFLLTEELGKCLRPMRINDPVPKRGPKPAAS